MPSQGRRCRQRSAVSAVLPPLFRLVLVLLALAGISLAVLAALGAAIRAVPRRLGPYEFKQMGRSAALGLVNDALCAAVDARFGFPTGYFMVDQSLSTRDRVVAREVAFQGTSAKNMLLMAYARPLDWGRRRNNAAGFIIGGLLFIVAVPFVLWAMAAEFLMRRILRSEIVADLADLSGEFGTVAHLTLRGPSAWLAAKRAVAGFAPPRLPSKVASKARSSTHKEDARV